MNKLRKLLAASTIFAMTVALAPAGFASAAVAQDGDLIKMNGLSSVYYLKGGKRYVFPNFTTFNTWYGDFNGVKTVPQAELESYMLGGNVTMRPGTKLVKVTTNPTVYAVEPNGTLRAISSEDQAKELYGANWNKMIVDVPDAFFTNYTVGAALPAGTYPVGQVVNPQGTQDLYYWDGANYRKFANESALLANGFRFDYVVTTSKTVTAAGAAINGIESSLTDVAQGSKAGQGTVISGSATIALDNTTPAAGNVPTNTPVDMMKINITAGNDGDASISAIKFGAAGLGAYADIDEVTVYTDGKKLGNSRDVDSNKVAQINFYENLVVSKGTTKTLIVRAKLAGTQNYGLAINAASDISATSNISGTFPIKSNIMSGVSVPVGQLTVDADGSLSNVKLGDKAATVAKFKLTNGNTEDVFVKTITLKKDSTSTASDSDIENLTLMVDGATVASTAKVSSKFVVFNLTTPLKIAKNNVKRFTVGADIIAGAGKSIGFYLDASTDLIATGDYYGYNSIINNNLTAAQMVNNIDAGKVTIDKVNAPLEKIKKDQTDVILGTFKVTTNSGKNVELSKMALKIVASGSTPDSVASAKFKRIDNIEILNKNSNTTYDLAYASSIGSGATLRSSGNTTKYYQNSSVGMTLTSGVTYEFVVRADVMADSASILSNNEEYTISIDNAAADWVMKETGNDTIISDVTPNNVALKKVTINPASVTLSTNALSTATNSVVGTSDVEVLNFNVKAGESTDIKMTQVKAMNTTASTTDSSVISELKLWKDGTLLKTVSASQLANKEVAFNDLAEIVKANTTNKYKVTVSFVKDSNNNGKTYNFRLSAYSTEETDKGNAAYDTTAENVSANGTVASGETGFTSLASARTVTLVGTGSLSFVTDNTIAGTDKNMYVKAGSTDVAVASLKVKATNEDIKITKFTVAPSAGNLNQSVTRLSLWDGSTKVAETSNISNLTEFTNVNLVVPQQEKIYTLKADFAKIGKDQAGALNQSFTLTISNVESEGNSSGDSLTLITNATASKTVTPVATKITSVSLENSYNGYNVSDKIASGTPANAAIIKITTDSSDNTLNDGGAVKTILSSVKVKIAGAGIANNDVTSIERIGGSLTAVTSTFASGTGYTTFAVSGSDYELAPSTTAYYLVKVTPTFTGTYSGSHSIQVNLDNLDGGNFVWKDSADLGGTRSDLRLTTTSVNGKTISN